MSPAFRPNKSKEIKARVRICSSCGNDFMNLPHENASVCKKCKRERKLRQDRRARAIKALPYYLQPEA
jgi:hypothetical protein